MTMPCLKGEGWVWCKRFLCAVAAPERSQKYHAFPGFSMSSYVSGQVIPGKDGGMNNLIVNESLGVSH